MRWCATRRGREERRGKGESMSSKGAERTKGLGTELVKKEEWGGREAHGRKQEVLSRREEGNQTSRALTPPPDHAQSCCAVLCCAVATVHSVNVGEGCATNCSVLDCTIQASTRYVRGTTGERVRSTTSTRSRVDGCCTLRWPLGRKMIRSREEGVGCTVLHPL